jgi:hypothetical protein
MVLAGYVYVTVIVVEESFDEALGALFIVLTIALVSFVGIQVLLIFRKYWLAFKERRRNERKKAAAALESAGSRGETDGGTNKPFLLKNSGTATAVELSTTAVEH